MLTDSIDVPPSHGRTAWRLVKNVGAIFGIVAVLTIPITQYQFQQVSEQRDADQNQAFQDGCEFGNGNREDTRRTFDEAGQRVALAVSQLFGAPPERAAQAAALAGTEARLAADENIKDRDCATVQGATDTTLNP